VRLGLEQVHRQRGNEGAGKDVRGHDGKHHRFGQGNEEITGHSRKQEHRDEHDADAKRRDEGRHGNLAGALENRLVKIEPLFEIPVDVFNRHRGVIDQDADGQGEAAERHDVDRLSQHAEHEDGTQHRKRNGDGDDQRALPISQKKQDHQRRETGGDNAFPDDAVNGSADENRLVEKRPNLEVVRQAGLELRNQGLDVGHNIERGDISVLQDGDER
jgi:hypothetical protein